MVIWKAQQASSPEVVGLPAMTFIEHGEVGAADKKKLFEALQTGKTMKKYSRYWESIVAYIWRTHQLPPVEALADAASDIGLEADADVLVLRTGDKRPSYRLNAGQTKALHHIQQTLLAAMRDKHDSSKDSSKDSSNDDNSDNSGGKESSSELGDEREAELERYVLAFLIPLLDHLL
jgi:hypothetical protein